MLRKLISIALRLITGVLLVFVALIICLIVLDTPKVDSFAAAHIKRARYLNMDNVSRDEDFSRFHINSFGLIGDEPAPIADQTVYRIAVFGDSFVEAAQVSPDKNFLGLLQKSLKRLHGKRVEVWNVGVAGDNTGNEFARWRYRPAGVRFDFVVFTFNDGDIYENTPQDDPGGIGAFLMPNLHGGFDLDESHIPPPIGETEAQIKRTFGRFFYSVFRIKTRTAAWSVKERKKLIELFGSLDFRTLVSSARSSDELAKSTFSQLTFVQTELTRDGVPSLLVGLPSSRISMRDDKEADPGRRATYEKLTELLNRSGVPFVDILPLVETQAVRGVDLYADWEPGGHFNRAGHRLIAATLAETIPQLLDPKIKTETP